MTVSKNGGLTAVGFNGVSTSGPQTHSVGGALQSNALLIACIAFTTTTTTPETVTGITDSEGNTWHHLISREAHAGWNITNTVNGQQRSFTLEVWYTKAATVNTSIDITTTFSGTIDSCVEVFSPKFLGYDATDPFDLNVSLPASTFSGSAVHAQSVTGISTDTTHIFPVWCFGIWGSSVGLSNVSFDGIFRDDQQSVQHNASEFVKAQMAHGIATVGPYAGVSYVSSTSDYNFFAIGLALTSDVQTVPVIDPLDGTKILEWGANAIPSRRYQDADYDSIWSRGDRIANGLFTVGDYGFPGMFAPMSEGFDNKYGTGIGNGPTPQGDTSIPYIPAMSAAVWWDTSPWNLELHGIKWLGTESITDDGSVWRIVGGFGLGSIDFDSYALEFDNLTIGQTATDPELGGSLLSRTLDFTPRAPIAWPHYELIKVFEDSYVGGRLANEFLLKVTHSILDGGDRRSTNGRPDKQVGFAMSSNWTFTTGGGVADPASSLFDGLYNREGSSESTKGGADCALIKSVTGSGQHPQITVGEWLEFTFPRKVRMHHLVFNLANGDLEVNDSGGDPTFYGKWHWEVSDGGGYTTVGGSWSFTEASEFMLAPFATPAAGFGLPDDGGHLKWRMVLEQGPAFGNDKLLAQIIFHLDDPGNQDPGLSVQFTDDTDGVLPVLQPIAPGSPYVILFTDGSSDQLTFTLTNRPNPILTAAFTDGNSDVLDVKSDLFPSSVIQTFTRATGR